MTKTFPKVAGPKVFYEHPAITGSHWRNDISLWSSARGVHLLSVQCSVISLLCAHLLSLANLANITHVLIISSINSPKVQLAFYFQSWMLYNVHFVRVKHQVLTAKGQQTGPKMNGQIRSNVPWKKVWNVNISHITFPRWDRFTANAECVWGFQ